MLSRTSVACMQYVYNTCIQACQLVFFVNDSTLFTTQANGLSPPPGAPNGMLTVSTPSSLPLAAGLDSVCRGDGVRTLWDSLPTPLERP